MIWIDYIIIAIIGLSMLLSFFRGFAREILALVNWAAAMIIAVYFSPVLANTVFSGIQNTQVKIALSFVLIFIVMFMLGMWAVIVLSKIVNTTNLTLGNRILGLVFGFLRGIIIVSVLLMLAQFAHLSDTAWWSHSVLIHYFVNTGDWLGNNLGVQLEHYFVQVKQQVGA
tara:strand:+ start:126954 stop:127463 length:510 start_codon:yes stop_codon:yes gene_type:complete